MFQYESVSLDAILKDITNLKSAKNGTLKTIPPRCLRSLGIYTFLFYFQFGVKK